MPKNPEDDRDDQPDRIGSKFARVTAPPALDNKEKRRQWGLPDSPGALGLYIVELNVEHAEGLVGAEREFLALYKQVVPQPKPRKSRTAARTAKPAQQPRQPLRIAKTYYRCEFKDKEWRQLVLLDEQRPQQERGIYRIWPDFPVHAQTDRSLVTVKADAGFRSFNANGEGITWAVVDSGIQADHPHFGEGELNLLSSPDIVGLHRCFSDVRDENRDTPGPLPSPDWSTDLPEGEHGRLIAEHRRWALFDECGHGTHVAGIIAGHAPARDSGIPVRVFEHQYKSGENKVLESFGEREIKAQAELRGVAPRCKLISLRVLDANGHGRSSQVIQALEYVRENLNNNTKMLRVHGINLSVGYEFDPELFACGQSPICTAVDRLVQEGVVVVTAAGNTGYGRVGADVRTTRVGLSNTINDPGNAAHAITVGATHSHAPHTYGVSYFSSKGPTGDGRLKPDLVAPGERVTSCAAGNKLKAAMGMGADTDAIAHYIDDSGTSMAAPHVSGAIAAFLSVRREFIGKPHEVKKIFLDSATSLGRERYFEGHGLVDLMRALQSV